MNRLDIRYFPAMYSGLVGRIACALHTSAEHPGSVWYAKDANEARLTVELAIESATSDGSAVKVSAVTRDLAGPHMEETRAIPIVVPTTRLPVGGCSPRDCPDPDTLEDLRATGLVIAREHAFVFGLPPSLIINDGWSNVLIYLLVKPVCPGQVRNLACAMARILGGRSLLDDNNDFFLAPGSWNREVPDAPRPVHVVQAFPCTYEPQELSRRVAVLGEQCEPGAAALIPVTEEHRLLGQLGPIWPPPLTPDLDRLLADDFIAAALFESRSERDDGLRGPVSDLSLARRLVSQGLRDEQSLITLVANRPGRGRREPRTVVRAVLAALAAVPVDLPAAAVHLGPVLAEVGS